MRTEERRRAWELQHTCIHTKTSVDVLKELKDYGFIGITENQMDTKNITWKLGLFEFHVRLGLAWGLDKD